MDYIDVAQSFGIVRRRIQALVVEACSDVNLTYSEFAFLMKLYTNEGCSQDGMADSLYLDKAVVTRVIKSLEEKNLLYREQDPGDRRLKRVFLTDEGKALEPMVHNIIRKLISYMAIGMDDKRVHVIMEGFYDISHKLANASYEDVFGMKEARAIE